MTEKHEELKLPTLKDEYRKVDLSKITASDIGTKIQTFGWVENCRNKGSVTFLDLVAQFKLVECIYQQKIQLTKCTSVVIKATVAKNLSKRKICDFELHIDHLEVFNDIIAPSFPLNTDSSFDSWMKYAHLGIRTRERGFFLRARSSLLKIIRDIMYEKEYIEITPPTIVQTQVEGGSTLFALKYYGKDAYLTQSSQLYLETVAPVAYKAFCIMPSYRAENSNTTRHLSEYTHVEGELANIDFDDLLSNLEYFIAETIRRFYDELGSEIKALKPNFEFHKVPSLPFKRIRYSEAIEFFRKEGIKKDDETDFEIGDDIPDSKERLLVEKIGNGEPVFLTHFLVEHKPFYMKLDPLDSRYTESCDLLFPGLGEILGGSMRCDKLDTLIEGFKREEISIDNYQWYLDMARYGPCSHGGYGLGFERLLMCLMRYSNIEFATLYPRNTRRCQP